MPVDSAKSAAIRVLAVACLLGCLAGRLSAQPSASPVEGDGPASIEGAPLLAPPLLVDDAGQTINTVEAWRQRRTQLLDRFARTIYGRVPAELDATSFTVTHTDPAAMDGRATLELVTVRCAYADRAFEFPVVLFVPNGRDKPAPLMLFINNRSPRNTDATRQVQSEFWPAELMIERGYAVAAFATNDVAPDNADAWRTRGAVWLLEGDGERRPDGWGAVAAWAWGASRVMDYVATDDDLDPARVAVVGHSRGGKAALWAGANDERFALTISNCSGCTGAALARHASGELIERINTAFPHWFAENYRAWNGRDTELPIDQHQLIAAIAPRAVYVASAELDAHADPLGEYLSLAHASPVFALYGASTLDPEEFPEVDRPIIAPPLGHHLAPGDHALNAASWSRFLDFADKLYADR